MNARPTPARREERAFTLVEVTVAAGLLALATGLAIAAVRSGLQASATDAALGELQEQNRAGIRRILQEVSLTGQNSLLPNNSGLFLFRFTLTGVTIDANAMAFNQNDGWDAANNRIRWGPRQYVLFEFDQPCGGLRPGQIEFFDGRDNDGDGLVDEGIVTLRDRFFRLEGVLAADVDKSFEIRQYLNGVRVQSIFGVGNELRFHAQTMRSITVGESRLVIRFPIDDGDAATDDRMVQSVALLNR